MSNNSSSDIVKANVDWLRVDNNKREYVMLKTGKQVLNLRRDEVYNTTHEPSIDYFL